MKAPNLKCLPKDKATEAIIFAGDEAKTLADYWKDSAGKAIALDSTPPVYLTPYHLGRIKDCQIVDNGRIRARIYRAGKIEEILISAIVEKLAVAGVEDIRIFKSITDVEPECLNKEATDRFREKASNGEGVFNDEAFSPLLKKQLVRSELEPYVQSRNDGVFYIEPKQNRGSVEIINNETLLCSPVNIIGSGWDESEDRYLVLRMKKQGKDKEFTRVMKWSEIGSGEGWKVLTSKGAILNAEHKYRAKLANWLQQREIIQEWKISHRTGWSGGAYIMPNGDVIGEPETPVIFSGGSAAESGYSVSGTSESWRDSVARLAGGNPSMMLGVATSLAAPMVGLLDEDGFGVHLFENSSAGKTTTADIATSIWGHPDRLRLTWYGTPYAIANEAEAHNDCLLPLDEIGQSTKASDVATTAYTLFNGKGKLQGAKEGGNREMRYWRTVAISTGEHDLETYLSVEGLRVKAGQLVRLLNVPMEKSTVHHEHANGYEHAKALKAAYLQSYGAVGRDWVKWLAEHQQEAKDAVKAARERWRGLIPESYGDQVRRVLDRFTILEAALIAGQHLTGWSEQASRDAIQHCFNAWVKEFGTGNKEYEQIIDQTEAFLSSHGYSRFLPYPNSDPRDLPIKDLAGYRTKGSHDDDIVIFHTFPHVFEKEISKGFNYKHVARVLAQAGMLQKGKDKFKRTSIRLNGRQPYFYIINHIICSVSEE
ncbi:DUF927 domain-containing protein [Salmonella enterica subsp. diarizonae]|nr:DUF927 domain-containing protein [Salmonella enterica subsp. diarizonae]